MQRGLRKTETKARKSAPSLLDAAAERFSAAVGVSAAAAECENHSAPAMADTIRLARKKRVTTCTRFIQPPLAGWASGGFASQSRRTQHWRWPGRHTEPQALQFRRLSHCFPQCGFRSPDTHSCASREMCESWFAAGARSRK